MMSFNDVVGPRTRERGFALAPEILGDEMQMGYGGGTCQASSTLHVAALFGALEIVERQAHSRPSSYTQMGLDATVSYPRSDLKIRNPLPYPVLIHAFLPRPSAVRVEILGGDPVARVEYAYAVTDAEDFVRRVDVKQELAPGQRLLHQRGIRGFEVVSLVKLHYLDGREDQRQYASGYRPTPEIYWVAPGYDPDELPPLPEHAKRPEDGPRVATDVGG
jgi:vancomycin resistance protein YoaR